MKKILSAASAAALLLSSITIAEHTERPVEAADEMIKIMCIGDSITDGYVNDYIGSYRKFIYHNLTEMGYNIDMVGSKSSGGWTPEYSDSETGERFTFDNDYTGYSGYSIMNYSGRNGIYEELQSSGCLKSQQPDIVTLQIGTNDVIDNHDMDTAVDRLEVLVDYILENISSDSTLFISTIPDVDPNRSGVYDWFGNYRHSSDWQTFYSDEEAEVAIHKTIEHYNMEIVSLAAKKKSQGKNVVLSQAPDAITDVKTQLFDGVHPNNNGYKAMGERWTNIINDYLAGRETPIPSVTTAAPVTTTTTFTTTAKQTTTTTFTTTAKPTTTAKLTTTAKPTTTTKLTTTAKPTTTTTFTTTAQPVVTTVTTTTTTPSADDKITISDMVKLARYINGLAIEEILPDPVKCDLNKDGRLDAYDMVLMRKELTDISSKLRKIYGDDYKADTRADDSIIINSPEDLEVHTTVLKPGGSYSKVIFGGSGSSGDLDLEEPGVIIT